MKKASRLAAQTLPVSVALTLLLLETAGGKIPNLPSTSRARNKGQGES